MLAALNVVPGHNVSLQSVLLGVDASHQITLCIGDGAIAGSGNSHTLFTGSVRKENLFLLTLVVLAIRATVEVSVLVSQAVQTLTRCSLPTATSQCFLRH